MYILFAILNAVNLKYDWFFLGRVLVLGGLGSVLIISSVILLSSAVVNGIGAFENYLWSWLMVDGD